MQELSCGLDWHLFLQMLPDLDIIAKETGAIVRKRVVKTGEQLLWLCMTYAQENLPLRSVAALSAGFGGMTDQSVQYRLQHAGGFLGAILGHMLRNRSLQFQTEGLRRVIRLQDATSLSCPGSKGIDWRLHTVIVPGKGLTSVELTDVHRGESLARGDYNPQDLVIADSGLAHAKGLHHVHDVGAYSLVRVYLQNIKLNTDQLGTRLVIKSALDRADRGETRSVVYVPLDEKTDLKARLIVMPLPPEQAALARKRLRKRASKKQKTITKQALRLAGYTVLLTTVSEAELDDEQVLKLYRIRWQIELFFKRCKSLLGLDKLLGKRPDTVRTFCLAKLIEAAALENAVTDDEKFYSTVISDDDETHASTWRQIKLHQALFVSSLLRVFPIPAHKRLSALKALREGKRKRGTASAQILAFHKRLNSIPEAA